MARRPLLALLALVAWAVGVVPPASAADALRFAPPQHRDARDAAKSPLDLRDVAFGQQDASLVLRLRTTGRWNAGDLGGAGASKLCVAIRPGDARTVRRRICVGGRDGRPILREGQVDATGATMAVRQLPAILVRPDRRTLEAVISPMAAGLRLGRFSWTAESRWVSADGTCPAIAPCEDAFPDAGAVPSRLEVLAQPACFGAAARDPRRPCRNPALRAVVRPTPDDALITPNAYCKLRQPYDLVSPCEFGVPRTRAKAVVVAIGDSHTEHWRGALEVLAQAKGWHGITITRASCPLTQADVRSPRTARERRQCRRWNDEVVRWLRRHREVRTVFVSNHATVKVRGDAVGGYQAAWRRLPKRISRIVVLRDTPDRARGQDDCVRRHIRARQPAGLACAGPRARQVHVDPQAVAAQRLGSRRVRVIDLTRVLCGARLCFPVIGGALVHKDQNHITATFATTLGPYLLRAYDTL